MSSALLALVLSGTLGFGPTPGPTPSSPGVDDAVRVRLEVDTSDLGADQAVGRAITEAVTEKLGTKGIAVAQDQPVAISIRVRRFNPKAVADFFVDVQIEKDGKVVDALETSGCAKCIDDFLVAHVVERVTEIGERVRRVQEGVPQDDATASDPVERPASVAEDPSGSEREPEASKPRAQRLDVALIASGSAGCAVGLGTLLGGVLVWADGTRVASSGGHPQQLEVSDRRGIGYGLVGVGTAFIAAGSALIVVGSLSRKKGRREHVRLAPAMSSGSWGASLIGRF